MVTNFATQLCIQLSHLLLQRIMGRIMCICVIQCHCGQLIGTYESDIGWATYDQVVHPAAGWAVLQAEREPGGLLDAAERRRLRLSLGGFSLEGSAAGTIAAASEQDLAGFDELGGDGLGVEACRAAVSSP